MKDIGAGRGSLEERIMVFKPLSTQIHWVSNIWTASVASCWYAMILLLVGY